MNNNRIRSRQEAAMVLRSGCEDLIGYLRELQTIHLAMNSSERTAAESEVCVLLRLRKVYFHVQAITSWKVQKHLLHVAAPDIRAAHEQLDTLKLDHLYGGDNQEASRLRRKRDSALRPLSHPTPMNLLHPPYLGGLDSDNIWEFLELYLLLGELVKTYGVALGVIADVLGHSPQSEIIDVFNQATSQLNSVFPEAFRPFIEVDGEGDRGE